MGWRENDDPSLDDISHDTWGSEKLLLGALLRMHNDRRIALARELLRDTGHAVAIDPASLFRLPADRMGQTKVVTKRWSDDL